MKKTLSIICFFILVINIFSAVTLKTPEAPSYVYPENNAVNMPIKVILKWNSVETAETGTIYYKINIDTNPTPVTELPNMIKSNTSYEVNLKPNTKYYWKITAINTKMKRSEGQIWSFTTENVVINTPPSVPSEPSPIDNFKGISVNVKLSWKASFDKDNDQILYDVYFGSDTRYMNKIASNINVTTIERKNLTEGSKYYWKVVAKDEKNPEVTSPVWSFTTNRRPDMVSTPIYPSQNYQPLSFDLKWQPSRDSDGDTILYDLIFEEENQKPTKKIAENLKDPVYKITELKPGKTYYWKIIAKDGKDGVSDGNIMILRTIDPPLKPVYISPVNNSPEEHITLLLKWKQSERTKTDSAFNQVRYDLYLDTVMNPVKKVLTDSDKTEYLAENLPLNTTYYWKVVVKDGEKGQTIGDIQSFTTTQYKPEYIFALENSYEGGKGGIDSGFDGLVVYNIANSANIFKVLSNIFYYMPGDMAKNDNNLFITGLNGLIVVNITNPEKPEIISRVTGKNEEMMRLNDIYIKDSKAYISEQNNKLSIFDISNPFNISKISELSGEEIFDLGVYDDYAYLCCDNYGLRIINIKDSANPYKSGEIKIKAQKIEIFNEKAYVIDETGLKVYSLKKSSNPELITSSKLADIKDIFIFDDLVYLITKDSAVVILNAANLSKISEIKMQSPLNGYVDRNKIYINDYRNGFVIADITEFKNPFIIKTYPNIRLKKILGK